MFHYYHFYWSHLFCQIWKIDFIVFGTLLCQRLPPALWNLENKLAPLCTCRVHCNSASWKSSPYFHWKTQKSEGVSSSTKQRVKNSTKWRSSTAKSRALKTSCAFCSTKYFLGLRSGSSDCHDRRTTDCICQGHKRQELLEGEHLWKISFSPHILGGPSILIPNPGNFPLILHRRNLSIPLLLILIGCMWSHATEGKVLHVCLKITLMYQMPLSLAPYSNSNSCFIKKNYTNIFQSKFWKCIFAFVILWDCSHLIGSTLLDNQQRLINKTINR